MAIEKHASANSKRKQTYHRTDRIRGVVGILLQRSVDVLNEDDVDLPEAARVADAQISDVS